MSKTVTPPISSFAGRLRRVLKEGLGEAGIRCRVQTERVPTTKLHRVLIMSDQFEKLRPSERQDLVWRIVDGAFGKEEQLHISMILTVTHDELAGA